LDGWSRDHLFDRAATIRALLQMAIGKFLDPLKPVMTFLALVLVKWHGLPNNRRRSLVFGRSPTACLNSTAIAVLLCL